MRKNMAYDYSDLLVKISGWADQSAKDDWIDTQQAQLLTDEPESSANELFVSNNDRRLIVAFMGGTGVGKSSLLNKLSGQSIARTGVERPTSKEVTLYHHQAFSLQQLDQRFPLQHIEIAQHNEASNEQVIWIDMPDFDSTEEKNKDIVMQWLPYIDVLIYVVSPERYRDNKAWQLLQAEGANHAWLFVMNQWDRGETSQYEDFKQQLAKAGFDKPIVYKTICHAESELEDDELDQLQASISSLATTNTIEQLENRNLTLRKNATKQKLQQCSQVLGRQQSFLAVDKAKETRWENTKSQLLQGFEWPVQQLSVIYAKKANVAEQDRISLWDDWAQSRFNDYLDELVLTTDQQGLPNKPLRSALLSCRDMAKKHIQTQTELSCRKALINPGNVVQRVVLRMAKMAEVLLPLIAMGLVGFQVFQGYYDSAVTDEAFLGVDFAVHSALLISISWLLPFFIGKKMQPSLEKAAFKGLNKGVRLALQMIDNDIKNDLIRFKEQHSQVVESLAQLINECEQDVGFKVTESGSEQLDRMLLKD